MSECLAGARPVPIEAVPAPAPVIEQPGVSAESFLPAPETPKFRPFDKLRARLAHKPAEAAPPGLPAGYQQVQGPRVPEEWVRSGTVPAGARVVGDRPLGREAAPGRGVQDLPPVEAPAVPRHFQPAQSYPLSNPD